MDYGVVMFPTEYAIAPDELARELEERGFESVWFPEHTHIPASRRSPWPGGGELPRDYWSSYDPFVALMAAAGATRRLKLGTGICLVVERDPITTAKEVATLDRLSGGRVPKSASVGIFFAPPKREALDTLAAAGVSRAIFGLPSEPREAVLPRLDAYAKVMRS